MLREELRSTRDYIFSLSEQSFAVPPGLGDGGRKPGQEPDFGVSPWPPVDSPPITPPMVKPNFKPVMIDPSTGYPEGVKPPQFGNTIPIDQIPVWLQDFLTQPRTNPNPPPATLPAYFPNGIPEGYEFHIMFSGVGGVFAMYALVDPDGNPINLFAEWNGTVSTFPPTATVVRFENGVPIVFVPAGAPAMPGYPGPAFYHLGGAYINFLPGAFPGVGFPVWYTGGRWYTQGADGQPNPWTPNNPGDEAVPPEGDIEDSWWMGLPEWMRISLIAAATAGALWLIGTALGDWLGNNEHTNIAGGGPPVPPDPDDSDEGGDGDDGDDGGEGGP